MIHNSVPHEMIGEGSYYIPELYTFTIDQE